MRPAPSLSVPERTCVGCRRRSPVTELARVALSAEGGLVFWGAGTPRPPGRGASLHASPDCLRAALKSGAFARAFRRRVEIGPKVGRDESDLLEQLTAATAVLRSEK